MPKITILVPIYNAEDFLKKCLDSIINQTLKDIEIICINDGSTDSSLKILQEYEFKDKRIQIINKTNSGYGHSMNIGLSNANGEYIGIVEPDDFAKVTMFEDLYNLAKKFDSDIVKSEYYGYTTQNGNTQSRKTGKFAKFRTNKPFCLKNDPSLIRTTPSIWSAIYKKEFLTKNNINFLETAGASYQDTSFTFKALCLAKNIVLTPRAYIYYRQDNKNSSVNSKDKVYAICNEYNEIDKFLNQNPKIKEFINTQKLIKQYGTYMWNLKRIDETFRSDFIHKFSDTFKLFFNNNEINNEFYKKINKKEFNMLISDIDNFKKYIFEKIEKSKQNDKRKKYISIHINSSRISIILFGKQILEIG